MNSLSKTRITGFVIGFLVIGMFFMASERGYHKIKNLTGCLTQVSFVCFGNLDGAQ